MPTHVCPSACARCANSQLERCLQHLLQPDAIHLVAACCCAGITLPDSSARGSDSFRPDTNTVFRHRLCHCHPSPRGRFETREHGISAGNIFNL